MFVLQNCLYSLTLPSRRSSVWRVMNLIHLLCCPCHTFLDVSEGRENNTKISLWADKTFIYRSAILSLYVSRLWYFIHKVYILNLVQRETVKAAWVYFWVLCSINKHICLCVRTMLILLLKLCGICLKIRVDLTIWVSFCFHITFRVILFYFL